jgi:protease-4
LLEKLGIDVEVYKVGEYKSAVNPLLETKFTEAERENTSSILNSLFTQITEDISRDRKMNQSKLLAIVDHSPLTAPEAHKEGLVDGVMYRDQVAEILRKYKNTAFVQLKAYAAGVNSNSRRAPEKIAVVYVTDQIVDPKKTAKIRKAFSAAAMDPTVKAVVVRVDCPGGTTFAAESLGRMIDMIKKMEKPVVASVGNICASGGYWVVASADTIVASPSSIVGSIGVFFTKPVIGSFLAKLGITSDEVTLARISASYFSLFLFLLSFSFVALNTRFKLAKMRE